MGQRNTQPESDGPDMNRSWPGVHTWLAESITKVIDREVLSQTEVLIDFHPGMWGSAFYTVLYGADFPDPALARRCHELGVAFGHRSLGKGKLVQVFPGPRSIRAHAGMKYGIPSLVVEIGGAGFGIEREQRWAEDALRGVRNVMRHLGMIEGEPLEKPERMLIYERTARVNPSIGGLLLPERESEEPLREVKRGELLGRIVSPYTFEELERLEAPFDGWLYYLARSYTIRPGHWAFGVIAAEGSEWITP
jgi:predicted deacylase